jgi:iron complex transport system substrate-binding protein
MEAVRRAFTRVLAAALFGAAVAAHAAVFVVDDRGDVVALPKPAMRIVTLAPNAAELVAAAGAGDRVVGVIKGPDQPASFRDRVVVGDVNGLDLERIVALAPDLIVTWPWTTPAQVDLLRHRGVAVFVVDPRTIDAIATDIERLGRVTGTEGAAQAAASRFRAQVRDATSDVEPPRLRVFYEVSDMPLFTLGGQHLVSQAIERCGGENVFARLSLPAPQVNVESVLAANPQVILAGTDDARRPAWLDAWSRWRALDAVRHHNFYAVDANLLHRPGPRFAQGVAELCRALAHAREALGSDAYHRADARAAQR